MLKQIGSQSLPLYLSLPLPPARHALVFMRHSGRELVYMHFQSSVVIAWPI